MTTTSITTREALAEATVTGDRAAGRMGRELAARTPKHAAAVRVRKPGRRKGSVTIAKRALITFLAAFFLGAAVPQLAAPVANAATISATPAQEEAACSAVFHYHHALAAGWMDGTWRQQQDWQAAWHHAWHEAMYADPDLHAAIHRYLSAGTGWSLVPWLCGSGL